MLKDIEVLRYTDITDFIWCATRYLLRKIEDKEVIPKKDLENIVSAYALIDKREKRVENILSEVFCVARSIPSEDKRLRYTIEVSRALLNKKYLSEDGKGPSYDREGLEVIKEHKDIINALYLYACHYAIGRRTYVTGEALDWTKAYSDILTKKTKTKVLKRLQSEKDLGDDCDVKSWEEVKNILTK